MRIVFSVEGLFSCWPILDDFTSKRYFLKIGAGQSLSIGPILEIFDISLKSGSRGISH